MVKCVESVLWMCEWNFEWSIFFPFFSIVSLLNGRSVKQSSAFILASNTNWQISLFHLNGSFLRGSYVSVSASWETCLHRAAEGAPLHLFGFRCWTNSLKTISVAVSRKVFHLLDGKHIWCDVLQEQALRNSFGPSRRLRVTVTPILPQKSLGMCSVCIRHFPCLFVKHFF